MTFEEVVAAVLMLFGVALCVLGGVGLNRFPDVFARMHAATKPVTLGLALVALGAAWVEPSIPGSVKLVLAALLQFVTAPVAAHMIGRAAYRAGVPMSLHTQVDELAGAGPR
jgi:multicomponent Na+:H+ antiporter subunit G